MAQDVGPSESVAAEAPRSMTPPATIESRADRARRGAYRYRFAAIYFFLAALVGGAVGATLVLAARDAPTPTRWSSFQPDGSSLAKVRQIADVVSSQYRANGKQLVFAVAGPPQLITQDGEIGVTAIAVAPDTSRGKREEGTTTSSTPSPRSRTGSAGAATTARSRSGRRRPASTTSTAARRWSWRSTRSGT